MDARNVEARKCDLVRERPKVMFRRRRGWIGIDIGSRSVKVAQVEREPSGQLRLRQSAVIGRSTPWPDDNAGMASPHVSSQRELFAALTCGEGFRGHRAACILPLHLYGFRGLRIPPGSPEERRSMIAAALQDAWDDVDEECEFDFWDTDTHEAKHRQDEPNLNVLALSRRWTRQLTEDAAQAGLRLEVLDGPPLAIARAVVLTPKGQVKSPHVAIDWGFTNTTLCVVQQGRALYTRRIRSCGLRLVCDCVRDSLRVTQEEIHHLLLAFGLPGGSGGPPHPLQQAIAGAAGEPLGHLAEEIRRTLAYFQVQRRELIPEKIWLMGGGASVHNAAAWLSAECGRPVDAWHLTAADDGPANPLADREPPGAAATPMLAAAIALSALPL
jgi:Tfp pilus assembly PilM family ATPase